MTHYDTLEVSPSASPEVIKAAYKSIIQRDHPDRNPGNTTAARKTQGVNDAYRVLSDPGARAAYDLGLKQEQRQQREHEDALRRGPAEVEAERARQRTESQEALRRRQAEAEAELRGHIQRKQEAAEADRARQRAEALRRQADELRVEQEAKEARLRKNAEVIKRQLEKDEIARATARRSESPPTPPVGAARPRHLGKAKNSSSGEPVQFWVGALIIGGWAAYYYFGNNTSSSNTQSPTASAAPQGAAPTSQPIPKPTQPPARRLDPALRPGVKDPPVQRLQPIAPEQSRSELSSDDDLTITRACSEYQWNGNVAAYQTCMSRQRSIAASSPPGPDLSGLDFGLAMTIHMRCSQYQWSGDVVGHRRCLWDAVAQISPAQSYFKPETASVAPQIPTDHQCVEITFRGKTTNECSPRSWIR